ncbi:hypothetical protein BH24ACT24_BH24ACT24_09260 [soil metagenome]
MDLRRSLNGALAGGVAAGLWAAQQPLDKRVGGSAYDDVELLGKLVTRGPAWPAAGAALHVANGALCGALYAQIRPFLPGPPIVRGLLAAQVENFGLFPLLTLSDRIHPARGELEAFGGSARALAQATWRHAIFGAVLGLLEARLNAERHAEPPEIEVSSNGYGDIEAAVGAAGASSSSYS